MNGTEENRVLEKKGEDGEIVSQNHRLKTIGDKETLWKDCETQKYLNAMVIAGKQFSANNTSMSITGFGQHFHERNSLIFPRVFPAFPLKSEGFL